MSSTIRTSLRPSHAESRRASWVSASALRPASPIDMPRPTISVAINRPMVPAAPSSSTSTVPTRGLLDQSAGQHQEHSVLRSVLDTVAVWEALTLDPRYLASAQNHVDTGARVQPRNVLSGHGTASLPQPGPHGRTAAAKTSDGRRCDAGRPTAGRAWIAASSRRALLSVAVMVMANGRPARP